MGLIVYGLGRFSNQVTVNGVYLVYDTSDLSIERCFGSDVKELGRVHREYFDNIGFQFRLSNPTKVLGVGVYEAQGDLIVAVHEDFSYHIWYCNYMIDRLFYQDGDNNMKVWLPEKMPICILDGSVVTIYGGYPRPLFPGQYRRPEPISKEDFYNMFTK